MERDDFRQSNKVESVFSESEIELDESRHWCDGSASRARKSAKRESRRASRRLSRLLSQEA